MQTSPLWDEIRTEGRTEGRVEETQAMVLRLGRQKFRKAPSRKQQKALESITDLGKQEALADRLLAVDFWTKLLKGAE